MAGVLGNNLVEGPALSLVRIVTNIDEIWERLKSSYGESKLLLNKKLLYLVKINKIWKLIDSEKTVEALSKIINTKKDLEHLVCQHNIQARMYSREGFDSIYQQLEGNRLTSWLSTNCDDAHPYQELRAKLTEFSER